MVTAVVGWVATVAGNLTIDLLALYIFVKSSIERLTAVMASNQ